MALKNTWFNRTFRGSRLEAEKDIAEQTSALQEAVSGMTRYEIPEEVQQNLELLQSTAGEMTGLAQEATDIAKAQTGVAEAPGEAIARKDIQQASAQTAQNILQAGGGGASALGALAQAGLTEQSAFGQLASQRQQYRSQAEQNLANALRSQASMTAQAAQLESAGLSEMAAQKQQQYEYGREQELTGLQLQSDLLTQARSEEAARRARSGQIASGILSTVGTIGGTLLGGPIGGAIANKLFSSSS